jgi:zinc D-Ala-D-Ala carboxypeptidase
VKLKLFDRLRRKPIIVTLFSLRFKAMPMNKRWRFFEEKEVEGLDPELVAKLDWARGRSGVPFTITSGFRSPEQNERVMGVDGSAHTKGLAVDLRVPDSSSRYKMVNALLLVGFKRIGVYTAHIHIDLDASLPQEVLWIGESH